jgi:hypothetical protein
MEDTGEIVYDKIPRETIITEEKEIGLTKWHEQWTNSTKGAVSKLFFQSITERIKSTLHVSREFTAIVTGHGLNRSYLHRFKIIKNSTCPCRLQEKQTIYKLSFKCTQLENETKNLQNAITLTGDTWPPSYQQLTRKHINLFIKFVRSIEV